MTADPDIADPEAAGVGFGLFWSEYERTSWRMVIESWFKAPSDAANVEHVNANNNKRKRNISNKNNLNYKNNFDADVSYLSPDV